MRRIAKYLFVAALAAFALASCEKEKENPLLNPKGTPVKLQFSASKVSETEANLKVVADVPVPADVTIAIALDGTNTMNSSGITYPTELVLPKGETEVSGRISVDKTKLVPGTTTSAIFNASLAGVSFGTAKALTITIEPEPEPIPEPTGETEIKIDGNYDDWADVTTGVVSEDDEAPLKEFKVAYDKDYLYVYHKRNHNTAIWGGGYYYVLVDTDNNVATGDANRDNLIGIDKWMYLYFFMGTADAPEIPDAPSGGIENGDEYTCAANSLAGSYDDEIVETEVRIPLADLGITYGQPIKVYTFGNKSASNLRDQPVVLSMGGETPAAGGSVDIDGNPDDWADLPADYVTTMECYDGAELSGLVSAKVYYDDKLYVLLEISDGALTQGYSDGKLRAHFYFDGNYDNANGHYGKWVLPAIDCMLEGKIMSGDWCAISSPYYQWTGTDPTEWSGGWTAAETSPTFEFAANGNFYECAMDYSGFPGGLADAFTFAVDIQDDGYNTLGFLPNAGPLPGPMALVVKNGTEPPAEPTIEIDIDGDFSDWALVEGVSSGSYGMFKATSDADYVYFYSYRTTEGRFSDIWGGSGYIYFAFDLDGDETTGVELWGNGPYEFVGVTYPYAGTADAPEFNEKPGDACMPESFTLENVECKGVVDETGAYVEFRIPRADLPSIPNTPITIWSWGNKDLAKVSLTCTL